MQLPSVSDDDVNVYFSQHLVCDVKIAEMSHVFRISSRRNIDPSTTDDYLLN